MSDMLKDDETNRQDLESVNPGSYNYILNMAQDEIERLQIENDKLREDNLYLTEAAEELADSWDMCVRHMGDVQQENERLIDENAELVSVVIDECVQGCHIEKQFDDGYLLDNMGLGTYENTLRWLQGLGYAQDTTGDGRFYRVWWKKQEEDA